MDDTKKCHPFHIKAKIKEKSDEFELNCSKIYCKNVPYICK